MRRKQFSRRVRAHRSGRWPSSLLLAAAALLATPTVTAYSDITALLSGANGASGRWKAFITAAPAGAVATATMAFTDPILTGSTENAASLVLPGGGRVVFEGKIGIADPRPDEERVTRALKKGRVLAVTPVAPPRVFSAGTTLQRAASLIAPQMPETRQTAFALPKIRGREVEIAQVFYRKKRIDPAAGVPAAIAPLVTNAQADVLATAYAPVAPDYARHSPFDSILNDRPDAGRFVPPVSPQDHDWAANILPPSVFSESEQRCLAAGIYFEARGEPLKGQAAVGQVILNRVRNPAYPKSICGVVYQNEDWRNACQFSFACDGIKDRVANRHDWEMAEEVALAVTAGKIWLKEVGSATHYHAVYVHPNWARTMKKVGRIGLHVFYRTFGGGWS